MELGGRNSLDVAPYVTVRDRPAPPPSSPAVRATMLGNRATDTRPEALVRSALHRRGLRFRKHARVLPTLRCRPDVVFPSARVAVFVDGCFWHGCPEHPRTPKANAAYWRAKIERNQARDIRNDAALRAAGWEVVRVWEHEPVESIAERVVALVRHRRSGGSAPDDSTTTS